MNQLQYGDSIDWAKIWAKMTKVDKTQTALEQEKTLALQLEEPQPTKPERHQLIDYLWSFGIVILCSLLSIGISKLHLLNSIMIYLLGIVFIATHCRRGAAIFACIASVIVFDFFFVPPAFGLVPNEGQYVVTLAVMLFVAFLITAISSRTRQIALTAKQRERQTAALYRLSHELSGNKGAMTLARIAVKQIAETFKCNVTIALWENDTLTPSGDVLMDESQFKRARDCFEEKQNIIVPGASGPIEKEVYMPLVSSEVALGVIVIFPQKFQVLDANNRRLLQTFANQTSLSIARAKSAEAFNKARLQVASMKLRNTLLSSVSHDLRTPLTSIMGAASSLLADPKTLKTLDGQELAQSIYDEAERLNRFLKNLLDMTRLESGAFKVKRDWHSIEEIAGATINRLRKQLAPFQVVTNIADDLPLVLMDDTLIGQLMFNLLDNAAKYSPPGSEIVISAEVKESENVVSVMNRTDRLEAGEEQLIFDKFYRGKSSDTTPGTGLGLTICKGIIQMHGGTILAERLGDSAIRFQFTLPITEAPPAIPDEESKKAQQ